MYYVFWIYVVCQLFEHNPTPQLLWFQDCKDKFHIWLAKATLFFDINMNDDSLFFFTTRKTASFDKMDENREHGECNSFGEIK